MSIQQPSSLPEPRPLLRPALRPDGREASLPIDHCILSQQLLGAGKEVFIDHHGAIYRLRETSLGKLILTK
ncbi:MAG: hemin uptake protein HemP [Rhizobacter sp.]